MATLKHIASKNSDYTAIEAYLVYQHDAFTGKQLLDEQGRPKLRESYILDAEFSALQSGSAELHTQLETLQPDLTALKNVRKYIDMVLNKQQLSAPGDKTPEKESVLKQLEQLEQKKSNHKTISTTPNREESL